MFGWSGNWGRRLTGWRACCSALKWYHNLLILYNGVKGYTLLGLWNKKFHFFLKKSHTVLCAFVSNPLGGTHFIVKYVNFFVFHSVATDLFCFWLTAAWSQSVSEWREGWKSFWHCATEWTKGNTGSLRSFYRLKFTTRSNTGQQAWDLSLFLPSFLHPCLFRWSSSLRIGPKAGETRRSCWSSVVWTSTETKQGFS